MTKYRFQPRSTVSSFIENICIIESQESSEEVQFPSTFPEITFNLGNKYVLSNSLKKVFYYSNEGAINGINTCRLKKEWESGLLSINITLKPWGLFNLLGESLFFTRNIVSAFPYLKNNPIKISDNNFMNDLTVEQKFYEIEKYFLNVSTYKSTPQDIIEFINEIEKEKNIKSYLKLKKLSHTTFNLKFKKVIGVGIKKYLTIHRFQNVISDIYSNSASSLTEIAVNNNFYDQSHFIKSFSSFAGMTPLQFQKTKI